MKGITHFAVGVAVATFFPEVVYSAAENLSFGPVLGGIAGLLPDTLDFKFLRYFERPDVVIDPARLTDTHGAPDPGAMAAQIAATVERAFEGGKPLRAQLHSLKLGNDLWQRWSVTLDDERHQVSVTIGPAVTTGQVPITGVNASAPSVGSAPVHPAMRIAHGDEIEVNILRGPSLGFRRVGDAVEVTFLPWHRAWTHSVLAVLLAGALGALITPIYGLVMALAVLAHILVDQLGHLGSNILFPLTRRRTAGLGLLHSGDALPNFLSVWLSGAVIVLNLDRFSADPSIPPAPYILGVMVLPSLVLVMLSLWLKGHGTSAEHPAAREVLEESSNADVPF